MRGLLEVQEEIHSNLKLRLTAGAYEAAKRYEEANTSEATTQTEPTSTTSTATDTPPTSLARTYAAAAVQAPPAPGIQRQQMQRAAPQKARSTVQTPPEQRKQEREAVPQRALSWKDTKPRVEGGRPREQRTPPPRKPPAIPDLGRPLTTRTLVMHATPLKYKPGTMQRWIEEDIRVLGIWWLLREDRRGQVVSCLVIYMRDLMEIKKLRMGRRLFRTTCYDWDR